MDTTSFLGFLPYVLGSLTLDLTSLIILVIIGIIIIAAIKLFIILLPAVIIALIVYFLTGGDLFWTGVAFLVVSALAIIARL
ncbi:MAG: hypothetical protein FWG55_07260 [Candidatus Bathyarchaeota archaeon]|nr:hypothetical protein [Candidatus Termiticorpusculum sp.]